MIESLCRELNFPGEAVLSLANVFEKTVSVPGAASKLMEAMDDFFLAEGERYAQIVQETADRAGVHPYALDMVFALCCAEKLRYIYRQMGWEDEEFLNRMDDLRGRLLACKKNHDIWGTATGFSFMTAKGF